MENLQPQVNKISQSQNSSKKKVPGGGRNASQQTIVTTDEEPSIAISRYLTLQLTMSGQRGGGCRGLILYNCHHYHYIITHVSITCLCVPVGHFSECTVIFPNRSERREPMRQRGYRTTQLERILIFYTCFAVLEESIQAGALLGPQNGYLVWSRGASSAPFARTCTYVHAHTARRVCTRARGHVGAGAGRRIQQAAVFLSIQSAERVARQLAFPVLSSHGSD